MVEETNGIFISYRRAESAGHAGRIADRLIEHFGEDRIFRDVDSIEAGLDFAEAIERAIGSFEVLIAVIGRNWSTATDEAGHNRLENPDDYVRLEIAAALQRNIRVIPVLVQGAAMPSAEELPDDLAPLARRQAFELHDSTWRDELERLITTLDRLLERRPTHLPVSDRLNYIGPDQHELLLSIPRDSEISQSQLEDEAGFPSNVLYWRLEQLYLMGLVMKRETHRVGGSPRYEYRLSPTYTRYLETRRPR
jgi:DNA-binding HxlR family transcriptional regulator